MQRCVIHTNVYTSNQRKTCRRKKGRVNLEGFGPFFCACWVVVRTLLLELRFTCVTRAIYAHKSRLVSGMGTHTKGLLYAIRVESLSTPKKKRSILFCFYVRDQILCNIDIWIDEWCPWWYYCV